MRVAPIRAGIASGAFNQLRPAGMEDIPALEALEAAAWPAPLQAKVDLIRHRFSLNHIVLVVDAGTYLAGAVCFVPTSETPFGAAGFPPSFGEFSSVPRSAPVQSIYAYNFCVHPAHRGESFVRGAIKDAIVAFRQTGARWLVGAGRCPSYAGSDSEGPERIRADPEFRAAIDRWAATGTMPAMQLLTRDPVLRFYHRMFNCRFVHLAQDFMPDDVSSGGHAVGFVRPL
jgi:hypothetical protein